MSENQTEINETEPVVADDVDTANTEDSGDESEELSASSNDRGRSRGRGGPSRDSGRGGREGRDGGRNAARRGDRESTDGLYEKVVKINRTAKVVKGGRRFSFSVLGVVGDQQGKVGFGMGKANGVPAAIKKALDRARVNLMQIQLTRGRTIPYAVEARYSGCRMIMRPASPGTGIIAGGPARAIMEALGVQDILTKKVGSSNPSNVLRATLECLKQLQAPHEVARKRGLTLHQLFNGHDAPLPEETPVVEGEVASEAAGSEA